MSARALNAAQNDFKEYPPFCELCLVKFMTNFNASLHFNGPQHQNRVMLAFYRQPNQNLIWCKVCCCELNTQKALEIHEQSPKHLKKVEALHEILELKKQYKDSLEKTKVIVVVDDKIETIDSETDHTGEKSENTQDTIEKSAKAVDEIEDTKSKFDEFQLD